MTFSMTRTNLGVVSYFLSYLWSPVQVIKLIQILLYFSLNCALTFSNMTNDSQQQVNELVFSSSCSVPVFYYYALFVFP